MHGFTTHPLLLQAQVSGVEAEEALREHCGQGRSFKARRWTLGAGPLVLEALGWSKEDAETVADADEDDNEDGEDGKVCRLQPSRRAELLHGLH